MPSNDQVTADVLGKELQAGFGNLSNTISTVLTGLTDQVQSIVKSEINQAITDDMLNRVVANQVQQIVEKNLETYNKRLHTAFDTILTTFTASIETKIQEQVRIAAKNAMQTVDFSHLVKETVANIYENKVTDYSFPDRSISARAIKWQEVKLSGDFIKGGLIENFNSTGIQDKSSQVQLTLLDDVIVAENKVITKEIHSPNAELGNVIVRGNLELTGQLILTDQLTTAVGNIVKNNIDDFVVSNIDLKGSSIMNNGKLLLSGDTLGPSIMNSNLRKVGVLQSLRVSGDSQFSETMTVGENKRVGINTEDPEGALTIWDEDAEVTFSKISRRTMRIGSTRDGELVLGSGKKDQLMIKHDIIEFNDVIRFMGLKVSVLDNIPSYTGEPNEIVIVKNAKQNEPRVYLCLGGNKWSSLA